MSTTSDQVETRRSVTGQQVLLVLLGLLVLVGILWFLFLRGDSAEVITTTSEPVPTVAPSPVETVDPDVNRSKKPLQTFEVFAPKDPFRPLIAASSGVTGAVADGAAGDPGGGTTTPGTQPAPSGGSDISGGDSGRDGSQNVGGRRVRLIDTFRAGGQQRARVQVDGTVYTVSEGDRFAENFELVSISGDCVSILYGDDQFSLCEGEEILK